MGGPNYVVMEKRRLNKLLQANLKPVERAEILRQLQALDRPPKPEPKARPKPSPYFFGVFGRPRPDADGPKPSEPDREDKEPARPAPAEVIAIASAEPELPAPLAGEQKAPPEPEPEPPSAAEIEALAEEIRWIVGRVIWLREFWTTNLSREVDVEAEAWRVKLVRLASKLSSIAPKALETAIAGNTHLLSQPFRDMSKPTMTQQVQERVMPTSIPSSMTAQIHADFDRMVQAARDQPKTERSTGYVPDGLESFVA